MESQEIQLENTVIQPTTVPVEQNATTHCFFVKLSFNQTSPVFSLPVYASFIPRVFLNVGYSMMKTFIFVIYPI